MKYLSYDLGQVSQGRTVVVTLEGSAANVLLLDNQNLHYYKSRQTYHYKGGYTTSSPYSITVPSTGQWHIVIDLGGRGGNVKASVRVV